MPIDNLNKVLFKKNWRAFAIPLLFFCLFFSSAKSRAEISLSDSTLSDDKIQSDDYIEPFLITRTRKTFSLPSKEISARVRKKLKAGRLNIKGRFSLEGESVSSLKEQSYLLPREVVQTSQLEAIQNCQPEKCLMKLSHSEVLQLAKSKNKKETYQGQVFQRIINYLTKRELKGYEDRTDNSKQVKQMIELIPSLPESPLTGKFLKTGFWNGKVDSGKPVDSWLKQEMVDIAPDQMQPILRVSEDFEFAEGDRYLFLELPVYTNHYFDSSLSLYEIISNKKKPTECEVLITDIMEIDELKKSALIRAMFQGKMVKAVTHYQGEFVDSLSRAF